MDDKSIVEMYFCRDDKALTVTADKYGAYCFAVAYNILQNEEDAKECVNDTYFRAWNSIPPNKPEKLKLYLARIARNLALNKYRKKESAKRGKGAVCAPIDELCECIAGGDDTVSAYELKELKKCIGSFVHTLPERDGDIFVRRYFFMEDTADISKKFGMRETNVRLILSRTRKKLRAHLEKEGFLSE